MVGERASPRIERAPSARGPNSMRPWNQPTALPSASAVARSLRSWRPSASTSNTRAGVGAAAARSRAWANARAEIGAVHAVARAVQLPRLVLEQVIGGERRPERAAGVAGRRLDPDPLEGAVAQDLAVGDAVERDAAGQAEIASARSRARAPGPAAARPPRSPPGSRPRGPCGAGVSSSSGLRGGPPNSSSNLPFVMRQAGAVVEVRPDRAGMMPSSLRSIRWSRISCAYFGSP